MTDCINSHQMACRDLNTTVSYIKSANEYETAGIRVYTRISHWSLHHHLHPRSIRLVVETRESCPWPRASGCESLAVTSHNDFKLKTEPVAIKFRPGIYHYKRGFANLISSPHSNFTVSVV